MYLLMPRLLRASALPLACALAACSSVSLEPQPPLAPAVVAPAPAVTAPRAPVGTDYRMDSHWLCRPGRDDICSEPLTASGDGGPPMTSRPNTAAPVDCFYVYPTISNDSTANSDLVAGAEERRAVQHQLTPFGSECRMFAPVYRQVTLAALRSRFTGTPMPTDFQLAYADVRAAWNDYLERDNQGRGVVLIGHSQGARMLAELIAREIEGTPVQRRIVSALLPGSNITVPKGRAVGGSFQHMPLCLNGGQTGCVVAYTAFRANSPPPADTLFGRVGPSAIGATDPAAFKVACTNPATLAGGRGALHALLPVRSNLLGQPTTTGAWGARTQTINATFMALPPLQADCVDAGGASYLAVNLPAEIPGDVVFNGQVLRNWGLHLIDVNLALGNLVQIVRQQARAHAAAR